MPDSPDKPFGVAGKALGLRVREPEFEPGEEIRWEARANRFQSRFRAVGGRLYLTDRRLVFAPHKLDSKLAGQTWRAPLVELSGAAPKGHVRTIVVRGRDGEEQRFVVASRAETAARIDAAIQAAGTS